jgi:hypothetical protein
LKKRLIKKEKSKRKKKPIGRKKTNQEKEKNLNKLG